MSPQKMCLAGGCVMLSASILGVNCWGVNRSMEGFAAYSPIAGNHLREQCYLREIAPFRATQAGLQDRPVPGMTKAMAAQWDADPFEIAPLLRHRDAQAWGQAWSQDLHPYMGPGRRRSISRTRRPPTGSGVSAGYQTRPPAAPALCHF